MQEFNCLLMQVRDRNQKKTFASGDGPENESISQALNMLAQPTDSHQLQQYEKVIAPET